MTYKPLLFINEYPPCSVAGAPVIARQLLREYPMDKLEILSCDNWRRTAKPAERDTYLPARHTWVPSVKRPALRPRRIFVPIEATLDSYRIGRIMDEGRRIIKERGIKAIYTMTYGCEFPLAAYFLSQETGLPLYYFETDHWPSHVTGARPARLVAKHYDAFLKHVTQLWLTSPAMVRATLADHGVKGDFLFHFIELDAYQKAARNAPPLPDDRIKIVYTGSINDMFYDTTKKFCDLLNRGLVIDNKPVELSIYSAKKPGDELLGERVTWAGFVPLEQIPAALAGAHMAVILVSFTQDPTLNKMIRTSLYTKTIDYLAAERPTLVVSPPYSGEVDYFGPVTHVVNSDSDEAMTEGVRRLATDLPYREGLVQAGLDLVRKRHTMDVALHDLFLSHFLDDNKDSTPSASNTAAGAGAR